MRDLLKKRGFINDILRHSRFPTKQTFVFGILLAVPAKNLISHVVLLREVTAPRLAKLAAVKEAVPRPRCSARVRPWRKTQEQLLMLIPLKISLAPEVQ